jgi:hypothetical protein
VNRDTTILGRGDDPIGFDASVFVMPGAIRPVDDDVCLDEPRSDVALDDVDRLEHRVCFVVLDHHPGGIERLEVLGHAEQDRFGHMSSVYCAQPEAFPIPSFRAML